MNMPVEIPAGFASIAMVFSMPGDQDPWNVTFGISHVPLDDKEEILEKIRQAWFDTYLAHMSDEVDLVAVRGTFGTGVSGESLTVEIGVTLGGGGSGGAYLPQNCALLVKKQTPRGGRHGKGRFFVPAILPEGQVSNVGEITDGIMTNVRLDSANFLEALEGAGDTVGETPMMLLHNTGGGDPNTVTSLIPDRVVSTQRRRLR
jgi:hypothetical protein